MELFSKETGCRVGEICGIHKTDIGDEYIHIHRQLVKSKNGYIEKPYAKNERLHPFCVLPFSLPETPDHGKDREIALGV